MENILFLHFWHIPTAIGFFVNLLIHSSIPNFMQYAADHNIMEEILVCTKMFWKKAREIRG